MIYHRLYEKREPMKDAEKMIDKDEEKKEKHAGNHRYEEKKKEREEEEEEDTKLDFEQASSKRKNVVATGATAFRSICSYNAKTVSGRSVAKA